MRLCFNNEVQYYRFKSTEDLEFHDGLGFWVFTAVDQIQFLVGELRSSKTCRAAPPKKKLTKIDLLLTVHIHQRLAVVPFQDSVTICNITSYCNKELSPRQLNSLTWNWHTPRMLHDRALKGAKTWNPHGPRRGKNQNYGRCNRAHYHYHQHNHFCLQSSKKRNYCLSGQGTERSEESKD